jgi:hypothetical protein
VMAFIYVREHPGLSLPNILGQERWSAPSPSQGNISSNGRGDKLPSGEGEQRYLLTGRVTQSPRDGHIIVGGKIWVAGNPEGYPGVYSLIGRTGSAFVTAGEMIDCEVVPTGSYYGMTEFTEVNQSGGAARANRWMREGNPLERGAYNPGVR